MNILLLTVRKMLLNLSPSFSLLYAKNFIDWCAIMKCMLQLRITVNKNRTEIMQTIWTLVQKVKATCTSNCKILSMRISFSSSRRSSHAWCKYTRKLLLSLQNSVPSKLAVLISCTILKLCSNFFFFSSSKLYVQPILTLNSLSW